MFFTYKSLGIKILIALTTLVGAFNAAPARTGADAAMQSGGTAHFAVIGDFGKSGQAELDVANLVKSWNPDFIVTTGDNNYPNGEAATIDVNIGQYYHEFIYPYVGSYGSGAVTNRFFPSLGNHDWNTGTVQPYLNYFTLPGNERYYDFVQGPVHFFILDSEITEPDGTSSSSVQAAWLQGKLAASTSPWKAVVLHHPPYSSGATHGSFPTLQWPYAAWGVDAVLAGHNHAYERLFRDGIPYFVNGLGGHPFIYPFGAPIAGSQVRYNGNYGAMLVDASETQIAFQFITRTGLVIDSYTLTNGPAHVEVNIGGAWKGTYDIAHQSSMRPSYSGVDSGPVKVESTNNVPIVAALRDAWIDSGAITSSIQLMGLPEGQLSDTYLFPAYNNVSLDDQLRFANVDTTPTTVTITIGGIVRGSYPLNPSQSLRVSYPALDSGPVVVKSSGGVKLIASIRDSWHDGTKWSSYAQLMGLPENQLSDTYLFPAYNNVSLDDQLRFGNVGTVPTIVTVTIGGIVRGNYPLNPSQSLRVSYPALDSGPVEVKSSGGVKIIASIRDSWFDGTKWTSYFQLMGLPKGQLSDTYLFPAYDNVSLDGQLRFANVDTVPTTITVTINGTVMGSYGLNPSQGLRVNYPGLDSGPIEVKSSGGAKIIASLRDSWFDGTNWTSYSQLMGLPGGQVSTVYLFPAYNNVTYDNQLRIAVP